MKKGNLMEKIQRLFNIDVREVSLVDRPAINESFIEVKRKADLKNSKEEKVMDEKKIEEIIQKALAPLADGLKAVETRLETQGSAIEESKKKMDEMVSKSDEGTKSSTDSLKKLSDKVEEVIGDTVKRFERIEGLVTKASSQKIAGQDDGDKTKAEVKWPSLSKAS